MVNVDTGQEMIEFCVHLALKERPGEGNCCCEKAPLIFLRISQGLGYSEEVFKALQ